MNTTLQPLTQSETKKYLTFALGDESYGVAVLKIREIIRMQRITPVPHMPMFARGVINLRGKVIPVIDLRLKFGLTPGEQNERTCIIVVQVTFESGSESLVGLIVDAVEEVRNISSEQVEDNPEIGSNHSNRFILGIAKIEQAVITLLDIDQLIGETQLDAF